MPNSDDLLKELRAAVDRTGTICCGGTIAVPPDSLKLMCSESSSAEVAFVVPVPCATAAAFASGAASHAQHAEAGSAGVEAGAPDLLQRLLARCSEATFGKGSQNVLDPTYRSALCLPPSDFATTFRLEEHDILSTIKLLMMPSASSVTAQLYKLNVYRPGDFFKPHVDTPRGNGMFGSLVVCLPQPHAGGALVVRHRPQAPPARHSKRPRTQLEHVFDWATDSQSSAVHWAAFYADCEHEILPVDSGYRLTLTYNLYADANAAAVAAAAGNQMQPVLPGLDASSLDLHAKLRAVLASPNLFLKGGKLAFACQHNYPHTHEGLCNHLDSMVMAAARGLGLTAKVRAVYDLWQVDRACYDEDGNVAGQHNRYKIAPPEPAKTAVCCGDAEEEGVTWNHFPGYSGKRAHWVIGHPTQWQLQSADLTYGNEFSLEGYYTAAAIIVDVPPADNELRKRLHREAGATGTSTAAGDTIGTAAPAAGAGGA